MFITIVIAAFLVCANGAVLPSVPMLDGRIVGGSPADITEAPYQVSLLMDRSGSGSYFHSCGGSIISRTVILTAAHCSDGTRAAQWRVRAGSTTHNAGGQVVQVSRIVQHTSFNSRLDFDITLMFVNTALNLGSNVATISLPGQGSPVQDGSLAFVTGWGTLSEGGSIPTNLYKVTIPIVNQQQCVNAYSGFNPVTSNMICAGRLGVGGQDACQGDSGGPLVIGKVLIGVTSWGRGCAQPQYPGIWTRVPAFRNWINANM